MSTLLLQEIENIIQTAINDFIQRISQKYDIEIDHLMELWVSGSETKITDVLPNKPTTQKLITTKNLSPAKSDMSIKSSNSIKSIKSIKSSKSNKSDNTENVNGCPYLFTKGAKEGEICNSKPKSGATYCSRHKNYEGIEPKQKKVLPTSKKSVMTTVKNKKIPVNTVNNVLRINKVINKLWHAETGLVFKSAKDRVVFGKCVNNVLLPLTADDIELCIACSFKYDDSKTDNFESDKSDESVESKMVESKMVESKKNVIEEELDEENLNDIVISAANKAARKITSVQKVSPKKTLEDVKSIKKSISSAISSVNFQAADVEDILGELQNSSKKKFIKNQKNEEDTSDAEDNEEDEEFNNEVDEDENNEEEFDEELVEEDDE